MLVWQTGQAGFVQELPKTPSRLKTASHTSRTFPPLDQKPFMTTHKAKPVRPVWKTGLSG
jgi:hypothetical protein